ncbi:MAG: tetratricopeptide repeat protein [Anaerolineae bacterium]|nr:tetratricopeptide repeat protein [Anaerolineae bacterium]
MRRLIILVLVNLVLLSSVSLAQTELVCEDIEPTTDGLAYYVGLGNGYYSQGNFNTAIIVFSCALQVDNTYAPALVARGFAYAALGNQANALEDYNQAIELDGNLISAYVNRGILYTEQGRFGLALTDFDLVIALEPENSRAYNNRGVAHAAEGDYDLAIADFEMAIALDDSYAAPYASLGVVYSALAVEQYAAYRDLAGDGSRLPAGDADLVIESLTLERETGTFNTWLALQTPSQ